MGVVRYRVLAWRLWYPAPSTLRKIERGDMPAGLSPEHKVANYGDVVTDLPAKSIELYLRKGLIEKVAEPVAAAEGGEG